MVWLLLSATMVSGLRAQEPAEGIRFFAGTWKEALEKSVKENKMIFLDGYTQWCGPCKVLAKDIFPKKEVGDFYNEHFINVSIDMEKGVGNEIRKQFGINMYPALLYLKPGGYKLGAETGAKDVPTMISLGQSALQIKDSVPPGERFEKGGCDDTAFLHYYFRYLIENESPEVSQVALNRLVQLKGYEAFCRPKYWPLIGLAATGEEVGLYFVSHRADFVKVYGEDAVNDKIAIMYLNIKRLNMYRDDAQKDPEAYEKFKQRVKERNLPNPAFFAAAADFFVACTEQDYRKASIIANAALKNGAAWQYLAMARLANWMMIGYHENRVRAAAWAQKAMALTKDAGIRETARLVASDLLHEAAPNVIPTPKIYDINL